jgi:hypothetical protein
MFSWFRKKPPEPVYVERVWLNDDARLNSVVDMARDGLVLVIPGFRDTHRRISERLTRRGVAFDREWQTNALARAPVSLCAPDRLHLLPDQLPETLQLAVVEAHPLPDVNRALLEELQRRTPTRPTIHVALDEPLLQRFGGERVIRLVEQMGMAPNEALEHSMISRALANARDKVAARVKMPSEAPVSADSMEEWLQLNYDSKQER